MTTTGEFFEIDHVKINGGLIIKTPYGKRGVEIGEYVAHAGLDNEYFLISEDVIEAVFLDNHFGSEI